MEEQNEDLDRPVTLREFKALQKELKQLKEKLEQVSEGVSVVKKRTTGLTRIGGPGSRPKFKGGRS